MFNITENYKIAGKLAAEGMVLLKNDENILPLKREDKVGVVGRECLDMISGGGGSANVKCEYIRSLVYGLKEKSDAKKFCFNEDTIKIAEDTEEYDVDILNDISDDCNKVILCLKRYGTEHADRLVQRDPFLQEEELKKDDEAGYFYPSESEIELFEKIENSKIENVVLVLNISSTVDLSFINRFSKIKAVLLVYLPGMEGGTAVADVLCGDVCPSGKLVDTIAKDYSDYPSSPYYNKNKYFQDYSERIFLGYRHFETFAKDRVLFPFGFGLSYTSFEYGNYDFSVSGDTVTIQLDVKNTGEYTGREIVELYYSAPVGKLNKPAIELIGFSKTKELKPRETERVCISFGVKDMASFDDVGDTGFKYSWILEPGCYKLYAGKSVRDLYLCGEYNVAKTVVIDEPKTRLCGGGVERETSKLFDDRIYKTDNRFSLYDVFDKKIDLKEFVNQLSPKELISLSLGQPLAFPGGTCGIGNLKEYGVPNAQTADGPAGIRRYADSTYFPCATLIACSWDKDLQFLMGCALGVEGCATGVDILLAPAMNLHRNPLCGRSFEYFSEDPLISGKTAAALVNGIQSKGLCATVKHFAANNSEYYRNVSDSRVDERTLRELYLKAFEIVIKDSDPAFVMSSYNLLNGLHTSANRQILRGMLREEWGYEGAVMTDWRNGVPLVDEVLAGNNIKMPVGYADEGDKLFNAYSSGEVPLSLIRENAYYVLKSIMKTRAFRQKDFGVVHNMTGDRIDIPVMEVNELSTAKINHNTRDDGVEYFWRLNRDQRDQRAFISYVVNTPKAGRYSIFMEISTNCPETQIWVYEKEIRIGTAYCSDAVCEDKWYLVKTDVELKKGENMLRFVFANEPYHDYEFFDPGPEVPNRWADAAKEDIRLAKLSIALIQ